MVNNHKFKEFICVYVYVQTCGHWVSMYIYENYPLITSYETGNTPPFVRKYVPKNGSIMLSNSITCYI